MACIAFLRSVLDVKECVPLMNFRHLQNIRHDLFSVEDGVTRARACVCRGEAFLWEWWGGCHHGPLPFTEEIMGPC
jgi:hypothetical protein